MRTVLDVIETLREDDLPLPLQAAGEAIHLGKFLEFELVNWNGRPRWAPSEALNLPFKPGGRSFLYRGQTQRYPTCTASLFRNAPHIRDEVMARLALERYRVAELELVLRDHPFSEVATRHGFEADYHGLAQHYGIPTSLLDLTSNVEIAAFFAVAKWDAESRSWTPMTCGRGVVYRLDWAAFGSGYSRFFEPVGFGPGLRPARQHAWVFKLRPGVDFQSVPHVTAFEFEHSRTASERVFGSFQDGAWLYPPDCLVSLVEKVRDLPFLTMEAIRHAAIQDSIPRDEVERAADRAAHVLNALLGIEVLDGYQLALEDEDLAIAHQQAEELSEQIHHMGKGFRLERTRKRAIDVPEP